MINYLLLALGVLIGGVYSIGLKPANARCHTKSAVEFFNAGVTAVATLCACVLCAITQSFFIPATGLLTAALFGCIFSMTVFLSLVALDFGPLSITNLIINFSLVVPLVFFAIAYDEQLTPLRVVGLVLFVICMFLFANPKGERGGKARSTFKWILLSALALLCNGLLAIIQRTYAMNTANEYATPFLMFGYLFATLTSLLLGLILHLSRKKAAVPAEPAQLAESPRPAIEGGRGSYALVGWALLVGAANFALNLVVTLLATRLDAAIVYPVIQGGGPIIVTVASRVLFKEKISPIKLFAILLGCVAIVLLNL